MSFVVVAKFPCKPGQVEAMGDLFRAALSDTREFAGCERIDVVLNEASGTYLLVEYWDQESSYDTYLKWRTDTGIAEVLAPLIEGGWDGILASVYRLGIMQDIQLKQSPTHKSKEVPHMINQPLTLPCGAEIPNRLCKAAMTEGLASPAGEPTAALNQLYGLWSDGGAGLLLSGNVQIDGNHLERPGNVIVEGEPSATMQATLEAWAAAGTRGGNHFWAQISHAGRQCQKIVNPHPKAPSAIKLGLPGGQFGEPDPMTEEDIEGVIAGFARCAKVLVNAGFTGVQLHAAHGYLLSQFLSPRSNQREDHWGGPLENRARLLLSCVARVRAAVGPAVPVSVKLNSADFQRGGFDFNESLQVARWLEQASVDLIEISGGTYEQPRLLNLEGMESVEGQPVVASVRAREAYFVDFTEAMRKEINIPLMVTGGLRRLDAMNAALETGCADMIGIGRPMCVVTDAPAQLLRGTAELPRFESTFSLLPRALRFLNGIKLVRTAGAFATQYWFYEQIAALGHSGTPKVDMGVMAATKAQTKAANLWLEQRKALINRESDQAA